MADDPIQAVPDQAITPTAVDKPPEPLAKTPAPGTAKKDEPKPVEPKDMLREVAETVVFVVVLVLLLKTFIAEAFVIPTGSMATTLWGYQKLVECPECGFEFPVNAADEVEKGNPVTGCACPNCRLEIHFKKRERAENRVKNEIDDPSWTTGDRVLVLKSCYDSPLPGTRIKRHDVVVFRYPVEPQTKNQAMNYIKRLIGLPGETIAIAGGQLYVLPAEPPRQHPPAVPRDHEGQPTYFDVNYSWPDDPEARELFEAGKFTIIRKAPDKVLALRRIVYDNDHQANDRRGPDKARWQPADAWKPDNPETARSFKISGGDELAWLRYRHLLRGSDRPQLITDFMGYNSGQPGTRHDPHWVGDLMLECEVQLEQGQGELRLELSRGADRYQARFDLTSGQCRLVRLPRNGPEKEIAAAETKLKGAGQHTVAFANFDDRLTLWVDDELPFGDGIDYVPLQERGPDAENDLQPASIAARGASLTVSHLKLWRDTYYTGSDSFGGVRWDDPDSWGPLRSPQVKTYYICPEYYLCLGDNSASSSDGRTWGMVPERLMLGRALLVYFPFKIPSRLPANRIGPIH